MSGVIQIKTQPNPSDRNQAQFALSALAIQTPDGKRLIPSPAGNEVAMYPSLEAAVEAAHRAGFDAVHDGKAYPASSQEKRDSLPSPQSMRSQTLFQLLSQSVTHLTHRLADRETASIAQAITALGRLAPLAKTEGTLGSMLQHLGHPDDAVRKALADTLARLDVVVLPQLLAAFEQCQSAPATTSPNADGTSLLHAHLTLLQAITLMTTYHPHSANTLATQTLPYIITALQHDHWLVRTTAAEAVTALADGLHRHHLKHSHS